MLYYLEHAYLAIEQQIAAIGEVRHDNLAEAGAKITQAEAAVASLMEKMHFSDSDAQDYGKYYFLLVRNIFLLEDAREAYNICLAEAERGIAVSLTASANETDPGEKVVVTYEVRNTKAAAADYSYSITYPKLYAVLSEESAPVKGNLHLEAGENALLTFVLTAREGGLLRVEAALCDTDGGMASERRLDVQIMGAGCYLGTTHSHSTESDGKGTLAQNFHRMIKDGMTLTYTADHNVQTDKSGFMRAMESMQKCGYRFSAIKGCEITVYGNNGHLLSCGNTLTFPEPPRTRGPETIDNWNRIIDEINAAGGYSYMAHPFSRWFNFTGFATDCESTDKMYEVTFHKDILDLYTEMTGIEIINDRYVNKGTDNDYAIAYWDRMNCKGYKKYFCSGGSDGHGLSRLSSVYNGFLLEELTAEALENAYRNGHQFVTTGPELRFTLGDKSFGETLTTDDSKAALTVEAYVKGGYLTEVMLYDYAIDAGDPDGAYDNGVQTLLYAHTEGDERDHILCTKELEIRPDHFYRVAVRTNDAEKVAFSNPVWVRKA